MSQKIHTIYGKTKAMRQWRPLGRDRFEINLLNAVCYISLENAQTDMKKLQDLNPEVNFEIRSK